MSAIKKIVLTGLLVTSMTMGFTTQSLAASSDTPYCAVTLEGDYSGMYTLRYIFHSILNDNNSGGCNIEVKNEYFDYADADVAQNLVVFQTEELCPGCTQKVNYFKIDYKVSSNQDGIPDQLKINPKQTVMLGNPSPEAINEMYDLYDHDGDGELHAGYQYILDENLDTGSVILDLSAFDAPPSGTTGIICGNGEDTNGTDTGANEYGITVIRNMGIASSKFDSLDSFLDAHTCLFDGGGNRFCQGTPKPTSGSVDGGDAQYDGLNIHGELEEWCELSCTGGMITVYPDLDNDTYGDLNETGTEICGDDYDPSNVTDGLAATNDDCDDNNSDAHPGVYESCDDTDDLDCDGDTTAGAIDGNNYYQDSDADGYGSDTATSACSEPDGYVATDGDCDDTNAAVYPGATDICNADGIDYDCDGTLVAGTDWYVDADADGYGDPYSGTTNSCDQPSGYSADATDCMDTDASIYPGATDECNDGVDQDCDGFDVTSCVETCTDGIDNDSNGATDCYDTACSEDSACTTSVEVCNDGLDNDYNSLIDCDDTACATWSGCDGTNPETVCDDGADDDGDSAIDCDDADCAFEDVCLTDEAETSCQDGIDDDDDTYIDCFDIDCTDTVVYEGTDANGAAVSFTCFDMLETDGSCMTYDTVDEDGDGLPECLDASVGDPPPASEAAGGCNTNCDLNAGSQMSEIQLMMSLGLLFTMILTVSSMRRRIENREKARGL